MNQVASYRAALQAKQQAGGLGQRPLAAHSGAVLRGVIVGPITPQMRAAQVYNVHLEGAVRAVLREVPLACPAGSVSYNGATFLTHLSEGDHVLVGFNNTTNKPVILCSLPTNEHPLKTDNEPNRRTKRDNYTQPPASAFKDFAPSWFYLGLVHGQVYPYDVLSPQDNQTNPNTTAGIRVQGAFSFYTATGDHVFYVPGTTYRRLVGPVVDYIPGIDKKMPQYGQHLVEQIHKTTDILTQQILGGGTGAYPESDTNTRLGPYKQEEEPSESRQRLAQAIQRNQLEYAQKVQELVQQQEQQWQQTVLQPAEVLFAEWNPQGTLGVKLLDQQPWTLGEALRERIVPVVGESDAQSELPTIFKTIQPVITHSDDPKALSGKRAEDMAAAVQRGISLLKRAQDFVQKVSQAVQQRKERTKRQPAARPQVQYQAEEREALEALAVLLDQYNVPTAAQLAAHLDYLVAQPDNLLSVLDFYLWLGDPRTAVAVAALRVLLDPQELPDTLAALQQVWEESPLASDVPDYITSLLTQVARAGVEPLAQVWTLLQLEPPRVGDIAADIWMVGNWLSQIDPRLGLMATAGRARDLPELLVQVMGYHAGLNWAQAPHQYAEVKQQLTVLTRRYRWQLP